ncbi:hypothetical protein [Helicobacter sp. 23-1045]
MFKILRIVFESQNLARKSQNLPPPNSSLRDLPKANRGNPKNKIDSANFI